MAIKKKVVKKETAKPIKKASKKPTSKPLKKKAAPRGTKIEKAKLSSLVVEVIENPSKGIGASVRVKIYGDKTALVAGLVHTTLRREDFKNFIEHLVLVYLNEQGKKSKKAKK